MKKLFLSSSIYYNFINVYQFLKLIRKLMKNKDCFKIIYFLNINIKTNDNYILNCMVYSFISEIVFHPKGINCGPLIDHSCNIHIAL